MSSPERLEEVFDGAAGLDSDALEAYLDTACAGDAALRKEVVSLLAAELRAADRAPDVIAARAVLEEAATFPATLEAARPLPERVGAFDVVRKLGEGGMGVVYEAYDARLDRKVAVKVVRASGKAAHARLLQEARALAKVAHPNVVAVHEVGVIGDEVFIVMELVEGETLAARFADARSWREVLATYVAAGRGLAAAHDAGVVHRDFKPDNVLIGADGRPRVADFGLARAAGAAEPTEEVGPSVRRAPSNELTAAGTIMGTPAFMSPEHFRGEAIDPRSDQFSFAVALYRGLFGAAPFPGRDLGALREAVLAGDLSPPGAGEVPPDVVDALVRALAADPAERFPSMHELLRVLEGAIAIRPELDPSRARNKRRLAATLLLLAGIASSIPVGARPAVTPRELLVLGGVALATLLVLGLVFRKMLAESAYNRRIAALYVLPVLGFVVHRAVALRMGSRVEDILVGDAVAMGVLQAFAGLTVERWLGYGVVLTAAYVVLAMLFPAWAAPGFGTLLCITVAIAVVWWRAPKPRRREKKIGSSVGSGSVSAD